MADRCAAVHRVQHAELNRPGGGTPRCLSRAQEQPFTRQTRRPVLDARVADHFDRAPARFRPILQEIAHCRGRDHVVESDAAHPQPQIHITTRGQRAALVGLAAPLRRRRAPGIRRRRRGGLPARGVWVPPRRLGLYAGWGLPTSSGRIRNWAHKGDRSRRCQCHEVSQSGGYWSCHQRESKSRLHRNKDGCNVAERSGRRFGGPLPSPGRWLDAGEDERSLVEREQPVEQA